MINAICIVHEIRRAVHHDREDQVSDPVQTQPQPHHQKKLRKPFFFNCPSQQVSP